MTARYVVVDVETTGNSYKKGSRVIQLSAVVIENEQIVDQFTSFVNPEMQIPSFIQELTGIDNDKVARAPLFKQIAPKVYSMLKDSVFIAHNVTFDLSFIKGELADSGYHDLTIKKLDTVELANILLPEAGSYKLEELADQMGVDHDQPHQADSDALATAELFLLMLKIVNELPIATLETLCRLSKKLSNDMFSLFEAVLRKKENKAEVLPENVEIYRGIALRKKQLPDKTALLKMEGYPEGADEKTQLLKDAVKGFEVRLGQYDMMDTVHQALSEDTHCVIEAGTGIGKSLGYLVPGLYFAVSRQQKMIISTYTVQLQHQLMEKEIRVAQRALPFPFQAALIKGRDHYLDLLRFEQSLREQDSSYDEVITKMKILVWLLHTKTGDVDELNLTSGGRLFWKRVQDDGSFVDKQRNPWAEHDFYQHAKRLVSQADLVITNHALLVMDQENEFGILPPSEYLIIDEAHHLEKAVRQRFGQDVSYNYIKFLIGRLGTTEKKRLVYRLEKCVKKYKTVDSLNAFKLDQAMTDIESEIEDLFVLLSQLIKKRKTGRHNSKRMKLRLTREISASRQWRDIKMCTERFLSFHRAILTGIEDWLRQLKRISYSLSEAELAFLEEMASILLMWKKAGEELKKLILKPEDSEVIWLETDYTYLPNRTSIHGQSLNTSKYLSDHLFSRKKSVVLTSASLTANGSFKYFIEETGMEDFRHMEKKIASPFSYKTMAKMFIPTDLPEIHSTPLEEYAEAIASHIISIAYAAQGRMLVLFSSQEMLRKTHELLSDSNELIDFVLLAQGVSSGSRSRLVKSFRSFQRSILFGTSSFWEGIDIPGEDLSCLIIVRLPFAPIDEPVTAAKMEAIRAEGKNPFSSYSLPEAIIQFKQGFGRLIRHQHDRGAFFVFDQRIITSVYGKAFLRSIPAIDIEKGTLKDLIPSVESWLKQ